MDYDDFLSLVKKRRSYWHFCPDPVPEADIEKIVDAARYAPSAFNSQPWEFVVISEQSLRDRITGLIAEGMPAPPPASPPAAGAAGSDAGRPAKDPLGFRTAPVFILVLGDTRVRSFGPPHTRTDDKRWQDLLVTSLAAAYEHMHLAAASLGLGTRWVSAVAHPPIDRQIKDLLHIPREMTVYEMMGVGHSDFEPQPKRLRPLTEVMHFGVCGEAEFRSDAQVGDYFAGRPK
jgi:nitroreductase